MAEFASLVDSFQVVVRLVQQAIFDLLVLFVVVELKLELLQLLELGHKAPLVHRGVEVPHLCVKPVEVLVDADQVPQPLRYLALARLVGISVVHQNDRSVVLDVPDDSTNGLVDGSCGLLGIPLGASQSDLVDLILLLQVLFLENHDWIGHLGVRYAHKHYTACCIVTEIESFRNAAAADTHEDRASRLVIEDRLVVLLDDQLVLLWIFWLFEQPLLACNKWRDGALLPDVKALLHQAVAGEEHQHAARGQARYPGYRLSKVDDHTMRLAVLVTQVEALPIDTALQDADQDLVAGNHMWVL